MVVAPLTGAAVVVGMAIAQMRNYMNEPTECWKTKDLSVWLGENKATASIVSSGP
jgi:hypothetical protein